MDDFLIHLRAWLCLVAVAAVLVAAAWRVDRRRAPGDTRGWKPTEAYILHRTLVGRAPQEHERLTVAFRTWRGDPALLVADIPAGHAPRTDRVWVLYDPLHPHRAQLALDQPDEL